MYGRFLRPRFFSAVGYSGWSVDRAIELMPVSKIGLPLAFRTAPVPGTFVELVYLIVVPAELTALELVMDVGSPPVPTPKDLT